jgi:hypothetical protein
MAVASLASFFEDAGVPKDAPPDYSAQLIVREFGLFR